MGHMNYNKIGKRCHGFRGFRLNIRRFSVQRLRSRFLFVFKFFSKWRLSLSSSYGNCLQGLMMRRPRRNKEEDGDYDGGDTYHPRPYLDSAPYRYRHVNNHNNCRLKSFARSNSFYSEAIADCLDFIKRNSISLDDKPVLQR